MRRRARIAKLLWFFVLSTAGCGSCVRYADCRMRRDFASCQKGPDCQSMYRCAPGSSGRGCPMIFDTCIARNHCTGTICF